MNIYTQDNSMSNYIIFSILYLTKPKNSKNFEFYLP